MTNRVDSYGIALPEQWFEIQLGLDDFDAQLGAILARLRDDEVPVDGLRRAELLLRHVRSRLLAERVVYAASGMTRVGLDDQADLISASLAVSVASGADLGAPGAMTTARLLNAASLDDVSKDVIDLEPPDRVELPAGPAVRLRRLQKVNLGRAETLEMYSESYLLPYDEGRELLTLQCVTPAVEHSVGFSKLFHRFATTLRIFREGDPTTFEVDVGEAGTVDAAGGTAGD